MNTYTIDWLEVKEWEGKKLVNATIPGEGTVTIWELDKEGKVFPGFSDLMPGGTVQGTIWVNPKSGKKTLYPPKPMPAPGAARPGGFGGGNMKAVQERKAEHIKEAQERKEESIAYFNAVNSAIAIVAHIYDLRGTPEATAKAAITAWRDYFLKEHLNYKDKPPF